MYASIYFYLIPTFTSDVAQAGCLVRIIGNRVYYTGSIYSYVVVALLYTGYILVFIIGSRVVLYGWIYACIWCFAFQIMESLHNISQSSPQKEGKVCMKAVYIVWHCSSKYTVDCKSDPLCCLYTCM